MAPEQAVGSRGDVGVHSDIYSLGAMFTVYNRLPFQAASPMDTIMMVLEQNQWHRGSLTQPLIVDWK